MYIQTFSAVHAGLETKPVRIEAGFGRGFSGIQILGNVSEICKDGKERACASLEFLGWKLPSQKINVSFTPGDLKKSGTHFDLALAVNFFSLILEREASIDISEVMFAGELSLKGDILPVQGIISIALEALRNGFKYLIVAEANLRELSVLKDQLLKDSAVVVLASSQLAKVLQWIQSGESDGLANLSDTVTEQQGESVVKPKNFDDMILTEELTKLAMVVAAGRHSILLRGSPGTGKTMFATRLPSLLKRLTGPLHLEVLRHYSFESRSLPEELLMGQPPVRVPHHTSSAQALTGTAENPGELALAHGGVLFLDELNEFRRDILESLREPLESGVVEVSRAKRKTTWKAQSLLVAACNNCPCGWSHSRIKRCRCSEAQVQAYQLRLSGPLQQRLDIHFMMPEPSSSETMFQFGEIVGQTERMRAKIVEVERVSIRRNAKWGTFFNSKIPGKFLNEALDVPSETLQKWIRQCLPKQCTQRSIVRMLRVARTLADLDGVTAAEKRHLMAAAVWLPESCEERMGGRNRIVSY